MQRPSVILDNNDHDDAVAGLARRSPEELRTLLAALLDDHMGAGDCIHAFAVAEDVPRATAIVRQAIGQIVTSARHYTYWQAPELAHRIARVLDAVAIAVRPRDPGAALDLLVELIETDEACSQDDLDAIASEFERAGQLFVEVATSLPPEFTRSRWSRVLADDPVGCRAALHSAADKLGLLRSK